MKKVKYYYLLISCTLLLQACNSNKENTDAITATRMPEHAAAKGTALPNIPLDALLKPANGYVLNNTPATTIKSVIKNIEVPALGTIQYDYRQAGTIAARTGGRIEKLYVKYRYQYIKKGQKVADIYSPELLTSQQNFLYVLKNDPENISLINAAKQRLLLLGMSEAQVNNIARTGEPLYSVSIFSNYSGYITDAGAENINAANAPLTMNSSDNSPQTNPGLLLKEGSYVTAGQSIFGIINTDILLVSLKITPDQQSLVKVGDPVQITAETYSLAIPSTISYIEPFFSDATKSMEARAYINNTNNKIPVGSQVQATIFTGAAKATWLPSSAVLSLGLNEVVFKKEGLLFKAHRVTTGIKQNDSVQIISGLSPTDSVAVNAQFLTENESFIQVKE